MKIAFLFSGQGSQYCGMGKDLYEQEETARKVMDEISIGFDVKTYCFEKDAETLNDTTYTQACIYAVSMAAAKTLQTYGITPQGCAGLSLGEYGAYCCAGSISLQEGAKLLEARGKLMANALPKGSSAMAAILMLEEAKVREAIQDIEGVCEIANINCPGQIVISGDSEAVEEGKKRCLEMGARKAVSLAVSGAFHSSLLKPAANTLHDILATYSWKPTQIPVYNNISGKVETDHPVEVLTKQLYSTVYFEQTILNMAKDGFDTFIEVGPGNTLSSFVKKTLRKQDVKIFHVEDHKTLQACVQACKEEA